MARVSVSLVGVVVVAVAFGVPVQGAASAPVPPRDLVVVVAGEAGPYHHITINASSDALGGDPSGDVSFLIDLTLYGRVFPRVRFGGPVTCLAVEGNRAVIGFFTTMPPLFVPARIVVVDNGSTGSPADEYGGGAFPPDCSDETGVVTYPLSSGDVVVRDAPSKAQCHDGGWRNYADAAGQPFNTQGDCIAFALGAA